MSDVGRRVRIVARELSPANINRPRAVRAAAIYVLALKVGDIGVITELDPATSLFSVSTAIGELWLPAKNFEYVD